MTIIYKYQPFKNEPYDEIENPDPTYTEFIAKEDNGNYTLLNAQYATCFDEGYPTLEILCMEHKICLTDCEPCEINLDL